MLNDKLQAAIAKFEKQAKWPADNDKFRFKVAEASDYPQIYQLFEDTFIEKSIISPLFLISYCSVGVKEILIKSATSFLHDEKTRKKQEKLPLLRRFLLAQEAPDNQFLM